MKKQNCIWQVLRNTRQSIHEYTSSHMHKRPSNTPNWKRSSVAMQLSFQKAAQVPAILSLEWLALMWAQGCSALCPSGQLVSTGANNLPVLPGPATALHQVLNHHFKPGPNSSPASGFTLLSSVNLYYFGSSYFQKLDPANRSSFSCN